MDCKDCTHIKNLDKRVSDNTDRIKEIEEELEQTVRHRIRDSEKQDNLYKLVESIDNKLSDFLKDYKDDIKETNERVAKIERRLDVNDVRTERATNFIKEISTGKLAVIMFVITTIIGLLIEKLI